VPESAGSARGQTTQDFALGVGVFLVTVAFVFAFVPSVLVPFDSGPTDGERAIAETFTTNLTDDLTDEGSPTRLNRTRARSFFGNHTDSESIVANYSVPVRTRLNVSLVTLEGTDVVEITVGGSTVDATAGDDPRTRTTATVSRVVEYGSRTYRLEVRAW
jgi:hypothetical protein